MNKNLSSHILPTASTMVGVCMTVTSIIKLAHLGGLGVVINRIIAIDSLLFLVSSMFSYLSIRSERLFQRLETWADIAFLMGLAVMVVAGFAFSFELL
jgi:hypothetical protein